MNYNKPDPDRFHWRYHFVIALLLIAGLALVWRMIYLMVLDRNFLVKQGDARMLRVIQTQAYRGMITDRYGNPLAISTPVDAAWVDPQSLEKVPHHTLVKLAKALNMPFATLKERLAEHDKEFVYLKRQLTPYETENAKALNIPGLFLKREYRRYYPEGEVTAHVIGVTNIDDKGQEGLELQYNKQLEGLPGLKRVIKDRLGQTVSEVQEIREPKPGNNLVLSIDRRLQYIAYRDLQEGMQQYQVKAASAVVLDVHTGEILAMVNLPSYNPNNRPSTHDGRFRNRAVTDTFEPGSTIKAFAVAAGLDSGKYTPTTVLNTSPGYLMLGKNMVRDEHYSGDMTVTKLLQISSNVGVTKIVLSLPPTTLPDLLRTMGLGQVTGSGFPGESAGVMPTRPKWAPFTLATLSFGYGLTVTPLQLAHIYATLANNGMEVPVTFLKQESSPAGKQVMQPETARAVIDMLKSVVEPGGTATKARVPGYWVSGKTGTSRIVGPHGYDPNRHNGVFVGVAPATNPRLVVVVFMNDPQGKLYFAGDIAGPVFSKIMSGALRILDIPPDHLDDGK